MDDEPQSVDSPRSARLAEKMHSKAYRDAYVASHTRQFLARQMREFRGERSQTEFGKFIEKQQTVVSRLEDPNYGNWNLRTLFEVAKWLNVAVLVRFVDFPTFLTFTRDMSAIAARPEEYNQDAVDEVAEEEKRIERDSALKAFFSVIPKQSIGSSATNAGLPQISFGRDAKAAFQPPANDSGTVSPQGVETQSSRALSGLSRSAIAEGVVA